METDRLIARIVAFADREHLGSDPAGTIVPGFGIVRSRAPTPRMLMTYRPVVCLVLQGAKRSAVGGRVLDFAAGETLIVGLGLPAESRIVSASADAPYVALALDLDPVLLGELAAEVDDGAGEVNAPVAVTQPGDAEIRTALARLFDLIERPAAIPVLAPLITREIHYWLLTSRHGAMLRGLVSGDSHAARIARVVELIRREFDQPLLVADLARFAAMSPSSFHQHFRAITGFSPVQFQKRLRLIEARRLMLAEGASVASAAFGVGYESPTQFSRDYARLFGAPPRREVAAARVPVGPSVPELAGGI